MITYFVINSIKYNQYDYSFYYRFSYFPYIFTNSFFILPNSFIKNKWHNRFKLQLVLIYDKLVADIIFFFYYME